MFWVTLFLWQNEKFMQCVIENPQLRLRFQWDFPAMENGCNCCAQNTAIYRAIVRIRCHMLERTSYVSGVYHKNQRLLLVLAVEGKCTQKWATHMRSITNVRIVLFQFVYSFLRLVCWWNLMWPEMIFENASFKIVVYVLIDQPFDSCRFLCMNRNRKVNTPLNLEYSLSLSQKGTNEQILWIYCFWYWMEFPRNHFVWLEP